MGLAALFRQKSRRRRRLSPSRRRHLRPGRWVEPIMLNFVNAEIEAVAHAPWLASWALDRGVDPRVKDAMTLVHREAGQPR